MDQKYKRMGVQPTSSKKIRVLARNPGYGSAACWNALIKLLLVGFGLIAAQANAASTVSVSPTSATAGGSLTVTWSGIATPTSTDWFGLYTPGAADTAYLTFRYTDGTSTGSLPLSIPATTTPGTYQVRFFANNGYTRLATSNSFAIVTVALSVSPPNVAPAGSVTAAWSGNPTPTATDWLGLYTPGAADTAYLTFRYTDGTSAGSLPLSIPATTTPGTYQVRLFANNGYARLATSGNFTVTAVSTHQAYYIHTDHLNTPRVITNSAGQAVWTWANDDPFGYNAPNENPSGQGNFTCNLRFPGQYFDRELNTHQNYFRDYDPLTGRYVQSDPIGLAGGINTYAYVGSNPLSYVDPYGLCAAGDVMCGIANRAAGLPHFNESTERCCEKDKVIACVQAIPSTVMGCIRCPIPTPTNPNCWGCAIDLAQLTDCFSAACKRVPKGTCRKEPGSMICRGDEPSR